jgi:hypothetical protein
MKKFVDRLVAVVGGNGKGNAGSSPRAARNIKKDSPQWHPFPLSPEGEIREAPAAIAKNGIEIEAPVQRTAGNRPGRAV